MRAGRGGGGAGVAGAGEARRAQERGWGLAAKPGVVPTEAGVGGKRGLLGRRLAQLETQGEACLPAYL